MLRIFYFFILIALASLTSCGQSSKKVTENPPVVKENDLPLIEATLLNGTKISLKDLTGKIVLVVFRPDCDHCQREAQQIEANLKSFPGHEFYFISADPLEQLQQFATTYKLDKAAHVHVGNISLNDVIKSYGTVELPSLYLYSAQGKLIQEFNGEVDISVVIKYL